jgi:hypothetical protein
MRFSSGSVKPSSHLGSIDGNDNLYVEQAVIKTRTSATAIVLEEAISQSLSGVGYTISDPLDIEPMSMLTAFLKMAEAEFARLSSRQDADKKYAMSRQAILEAMEADGDRVTNQRGRMVYNPYRGTVTTDA